MNTPPYLSSQQASMRTFVSAEIQPLGALLQPGTLARPQILDLLENLKTRRQLGILLVTHDIGVVARLADRMAVMEAGRIVETERAATLFAKPQHSVSRLMIETHLSLYEQMP